MLNETLRKAALEMAESQEAAIPGLEDKKMHLETQLSEIKDQLNSANRALERARNFPVKSGSDYICPSCWVYDDATSVLRPISGTENEDRFKCRTCGSEWSETF